MDKKYPDCLERHHSLIIDGFKFQLSRTNTKLIIAKLIEYLEQEALEVQPKLELFYHQKCMEKISLRETLNSINELDKSLNP